MLPSKQKTCASPIKFIQRRPNVFDVVPTLYKCHTNFLCLLGNGYIKSRRLSESVSKISEEEKT